MIGPDDYHNSHSNLTIPYEINLNLCLDIKMDNVYDELYTYFMKKCNFIILPT